MVWGGMVCGVVGVRDQIGWDVVGGVRWDEIGCDRMTPNEPYEMGSSSVGSCNACIATYT